MPKIWESYQNLFVGSSVGITVNDGNGVRIDVNPKFCEMLGCRREELIGSRALDVVHPDDREVGRKVGKSWRSGTQKAGENFELRFIHKNGDVVWALSNICWSESKDAEDGFAIVQFIDISERKKIEIELRLSESRLRDFAESASDWLWETGPDSGFKYFSNSIDEFTGVSGDARIGKTREELVDEDTNSEKWQRFRATLEAREPVRNFEY